MDVVGTKRRRKLNDEQLEVLRLLHKFRFGTNDLFAQYFGKKDRSFVYKRLSILQERGFVGKRFDASYRLQGKPAAYYLTPDGARAIQEANRAEINVKAIYKERTVSEDFIARCLDIFATYNILHTQYGARLKFFTKSNLNYEQFDYFPHPLPDSYVRIGNRQFFIDFLYEAQPAFTLARRIKQYIDYVESDEWEATGTDLPVVLFICESANLQKRLQKRLTRSVDGDVTFASTTKGSLTNGETAIWQPATESGETVTLEAIS